MEVPVVPETTAPAALTPAAESDGVNYALIISIIAAAIIVAFSGLIYHYRGRMREMCLVTLYPLLWCLNCCLRVHATRPNDSKYN